MLFLVYNRDHVGVVIVVDGVLVARCVLVFVACAAALSEEF
jgi:hypothetical protein